MSKILKRLSVLICGCLVAVCALSTFAGSKDSVSTPTRDVELVKQNVEIDSNFEKFEFYDLEFNEGEVDFVGYDSIKLSALYEFDLLSDEIVDNEVLTKYSCTYDYENGTVALGVTLINGEETSIIDTIYGVIIMDEELNYDVIFDCDGEVLLLSELEEAGMLDNCGFFSKLKKVWNTSAGKIGTIATVATCAVVGVVCAVVPGGQLVTAACIGVAVGAIGGAITAGVATYLEDGTIDWGAVGSYAVAGGVVGAVVSGVSFKVSSIIKGATTTTTTNVNANIGNKLDYAFGKATGDAHNVQRSMTMQSQLSKIGIYDDVAGRQIMTNFMNQTLNANLSGIISTTERVAVDSLLAGPGGFLQVRTIWEGTKLITFIFFG